MKEVEDAVALSADRPAAKVAACVAEKGKDWAGKMKVTASSLNTAHSKPY